DVWGVDAGWNDRDARRRDRVVVDQDLAEGGGEDDQMVSGPVATQFDEPLRRDRGTARTGCGAFSRPRAMEVDDLHGVGRIGSGPRSVDGEVSVGDVRGSGAGSASRRSQPMQGAA